MVAIVRLFIPLYHRRIIKTSMVVLYDSLNMYQSALGNVDVFTVPATRWSIRSAGYELSD